MATQELSPADRIRELNGINEELAAMMQRMAQTVSQLSPTAGDVGDGVDARKEAFEKHARASYTHLQSVVAKLRRQTYALEEAGIITADAPKFGSRQQAEGERITNGGLGKLDIGWLNSRGNKVGAEKEAELVTEAKELLEEALSQR